MFACACVHVGEVCAGACAFGALHSCGVLPPPLFFYFYFFIFYPRSHRGDLVFLFPSPLSQVREMKRITDEDSARFRGLPFRSLFVFVATYLPAH